MRLKYFWMIAICFEVNGIPARERDAFTLEHRLLVFCSALRFYADFTFGIDHPVPWKVMFFTARMKDPNDLPRTARTSGELSNLTICHHFTGGDSLYDMNDPFSKTFQIPRPFILSVC
jgi:hypothetical protein